MKVVIVDDNSLHLKMCTILLQNLGHDVVTALNMSEFKKKMKEMDGAPDAAIIDYRLQTGETGVDILRFIKESGEWKTTKMIALTADVSEKGLLESSGFDKVVFKPVTESLLKEIIR